MPVSEVSTSTTRAAWAKRLPHPAIILDDSPQLRKVITEMEAGTYPLPEDAIWREDLPRDLRVRLARATGGTDEQIAGALADEPVTA